MASSTGPRTPAPKVASWLFSSKESSASSAPRSSVSSGASPPAALTCPTTLVPPPYGMTRALTCAAQASRSRTSAELVGCATPSGMAPSRPLRTAIQSGRLWPRA
ncbi:MAG: hypothetical protein QM765_27890 [Myxococcales bacterium]